MVFTGARGGDETDRHVGFVVGRYRNGALSDAWTDVQRCAENTFTAYHAACRCGWIGPTRHPDAAGADDCRHDWLRRDVCDDRTTAGDTAGREPRRRQPAEVSPDPRSPARAALSARHDWG